LLQINRQADAFGPRYQFATLGKVWTDYLAQTLEGACPGQGRPLAAALMAGSREVESAEYGYQLYEAAIAATHDPAALTYLATEPFDAQGWHHLPTHSPFRQAVTTFMEAFGHRSIYELELSNPRWCEEPSYLFDCMRILLKQETITIPYDVAREKRQLAEAEVARLPGHIRSQVNWFAKQARRAVSHREAGKSTLVQLLQPLRMIALEVGKRMAAAHILQHQQDIFFLAWPDLSAFLRGTWDGQGAQTLVQDRKEQHSTWLSATPDDVFICDAQGQPTELPTNFVNKTLEVHTEIRADGKNVLYGVGASSGRASGRARIIRHPNEGHRLQTGEILVAPSTDPGWTPLFLRANAVIMETGGYLSHGAIVAREFGIPAVINIPGMLEMIKDGQYLTVDGNKGHIIIEPPL
jgi:phosphohistidine swiveling domain-containing protein